VNTEQLRTQARHHLGPFFTTGDQWRSPALPVFVRGDGCYLHDSDGRRFLDGLAGLLCVNLGHGRTDLPAVAAKQMQTLPYAPLFGAAHPPAIETAAAISELAPGDLSTTFFVNSGSEATECAIKFARQYHRANGEPRRTRIISREMANHGTTVGAMSVSGLPALREPFVPAMDHVRHVPNTLQQTVELGTADGVACAQEIERAILEEGPENVAAVFAEPVQNAGGALVPPDGYWTELRRICDRHGVLLVADEVICSFGRLGSWFGCEAFEVVPDLVTFAKGATSGYVPIGGMIARRPLAERLLGEGGGGFTHGATWGGHPVATAVVAAVIDVLRTEQILPHVRQHGPRLAGGLHRLKNAHRCVKDVRGMGFLYAVELMADRRSGREFTQEEATRVLREVLPAAFRRTGVLLRGDNRGGTLIMISPPLVADSATLDELLGGLDGILDDVEAAVAA
jgi:adenosylmethionine-8-amino-7-oxononanoate aminotransferase